ncbi:unnamed protein product [Orchesella dallaii]|uniref:Uncharacterized protein n=1 Tax=Orchesella dallaii TaxID=48710 RepID=A0ABP1RBE1_9HEXA
MKSKFPEINNEDRFMYRQPSTVDYNVAMFQIEGERTKYFKFTSKRRVIIFESYFALLYPGRMVKRPPSQPPTTSSQFLRENSAPPVQRPSALHVNSETSLHNSSALSAHPSVPLANPSGQLPIQHILRPPQFLPYRQPIEASAKLNSVVAPTPLSIPTNLQWQPVRPLGMINPQYQPNLRLPHNYSTQVHGPLLQQRNATAHYMLGANPYQRQLEAQLQSKEEELKGSRDLIDVLKKEQESLRGKSEENEDLLQKNEELQKLVQETKQTVADHKKQIDELSKSKEAYKSKNTVLTNRKAARQKKQDDTLVKLKEFEETVASHKNTIELLENNNSTIQADHLVKVKNLESNLAAANQRIAELNYKLNEAAKIVSNLSLEKETLSNQVETLETDIRSRASEKEDLIFKYENDVHKVMEQLKLKKEKINEFTARAAKMEQEFDDSQLEFQSEIKRLNEQVNSESQRALRGEQVQQEQLATLQALNKQIEDQAKQLKEQHLHEKNELQNELQQKNQTISDEHNRNDDLSECNLKLRQENTELRELLHQKRDDVPLDKFESLQEDFRNQIGVVKRTKKELVDHQTKLETYRKFEADENKEISVLKYHLKHKSKSITNLTSQNEVLVNLLKDLENKCVVLNDTYESKFKGLYLLLDDLRRRMDHCEQVEKDRLRNLQNVYKEFGIQAAEIVRQRKINGELEKIIRENDDELKSIHGKLKSSLDEADSLKVDVQRVLKLLTTFHEERHMESISRDPRMVEKNVELTNLQQLLMQKESEVQSVGERVKSLQCELENSNKESVSKSQQLELLQQQFDMERERTRNAVTSEREYINQMQDLRSQITIKKEELQSKCNIISAQNTLLDINTCDLNAAKNSYNQLKEEIGRLEVDKFNLGEQLARLLVENTNE